MNALVARRRNAEDLLPGSRIILSREQAFEGRLKRKETQGSALGPKWHVRCSKTCVHKVLRLFLFAFCLSVGAQLSRAETASYPEKNPVFTVEAPIGWQIKRENGALKLIPQANAVCLLQYVENVKDEETARTGLPELTSLEGHQFNLDNLVISAKPKAVRLGDFNGFTTDGRGVDKAGNETFLQTMLVAPKEGVYYLVTCLWTKDDQEKTAADRTAIFNSLKSLNSVYMYR